MRLKSTIISIAIITIIVLAASIAFAQENNTTTNTTTTTLVYNISIVNVTFPTYNLPVVHYSYISNDTVEVIATCTWLQDCSDCPPVTIKVGWNGTIYLDTTVDWCNVPRVTDYTAKYIVNVTVQSDQVWVYYNYTLGGSTYESNETIRWIGYSPPPGYEWIRTVLPLAVFVAFSLRGTPDAIAIGMIASGIVSMAMMAIGLAAYDPLFISLPIIVGGILLWLGRK